MLHNIVVNYATVCEGRVNQTNGERYKEYKGYRILFLECHEGGKADGGEGETEGGSVERARE